MLQKGFSPILVLIIILAVIGIAFVVLMFNKAKKPTQNLPPIAIPIATPATSISPVRDLYFYELEIQKKPNSAVPSGPLGSYLTKVLNLPLSYQQNFNLGLGYLMYDFRNTDPFKDPYDGTYFLVIQNAKQYNVQDDFQLDYNQVYQDDSVTIKVGTPSASLLPYMSPSSKYCQTDSDCTWAYKYCQSGPNNFYTWASDQGSCEVATPENNKQVGCVNNQCASK